MRLTGGPPDRRRHQSGISFIKLLGVGMIVALVVDATVVRVMLVPATMRLLAGANWWSPALLRRLYVRYGIRESAAPPSRSRSETEGVPNGP